MAFKTYISLISRNLANIPGWRTNRHLVVIESDDWGSIRMPSKKVFDNLVKAGIDLYSDDGFIFNKYDSLATADDLSALYEVLYTTKDYTGRPGVFTPVAVVANPDFKKIYHNGFSDYYYEPFTETLRKYYGSDDAFSLWKDGIQARVFVPQFHGREHLNVQAWMRALKSGNEKIILAFSNEMWGIATSPDPEIRLEIQAAFDFIDPDDLNYHKDVITSGLALFEDLFGYGATYFVPPNGPISSKLESVCKQNGIKYLSVAKVQNEPLGMNQYGRRLNWLGKKRASGLYCITRNCQFEPGKPNRDWVGSCLKEIDIAFKWHKPAVISTHRVNYIGALEDGNRRKGLVQLKSLLCSILKIWPDVQFLTSAELGDLISNE